MKHGHNFFLSHVPHAACLCCIVLVRGLVGPFQSCIRDGYSLAMESKWVPKPAKWLSHWPKCSRYQRGVRLQSGGKRQKCQFESSLVLICQAVENYILLLRTPRIGFFAHLSICSRCASILRAQRHAQGCMPRPGSHCQVGLLVSAWQTHTSKCCIVLIARLWLTAVVVV